MAETIAIASDHAAFDMKAALTDWLRAEGCNEVQGFLFSPAKPASEIENLLRRFGSQASRAA